MVVAGGARKTGQLQGLVWEKKPTRGNVDYFTSVDHSELTWFEEYEWRDQSHGIQENC